MDLPFFERASRRAFLRRGVEASGLLAAGSVLAACSKDDASSFARSTTHSSVLTADSATAPAVVSVAPTTTTPATQPTPSTPSTQATPDSTTATAGSPGGAGRSTSISVSYTAADSGRRVRNPYLAVWTENAAGEMTALISLIYLARESKYVRELTGVSAHLQTVDGTAVDAVTGSTRSAGSYSFTFDGLGLDGSPLSGPQTLFIESAREHGPHSLVSGQVDFSRVGVVKLADDGELSAATVSVG